MRIFVMTLLALMASWSLTGCKAGEGDGCGKPEDCRTGLKCDEGGDFKCFKPRGPRECQASDDCQKDGLCSSRRGKCLALTIDDCNKKSKVCSQFGLCELAENKCVATRFTCERSTGCLKNHKCLLDGQKCVAGSGLEDAERRCNSGDSAGCAKLGWHYKEGENVPKDGKRALGYLKRACVGKNDSGCYSIGVMYYNGKLLARNYKKAYYHFEMACEHGSDVGCYETANRLIDGRGVSRDPAKASRFYEKACKLNHKKACEKGRS